MGPFKGELPVFARLWPGKVRVSVSFTTGAVGLALLATAELLVLAWTIVGALQIGFVFVFVPNRRVAR